MAASAGCAPSVGAAASMARSPSEATTGALVRSATPAAATTLGRRRRRRVGEPVSTACSPASGLDAVDRSAVAASTTVGAAAPLSSMVTAAGGDTGGATSTLTGDVGVAAVRSAVTVAAGRMRRRAGRATTMGTSVGSTGARLSDSATTGLRQALRYCCCWRRCGHEVAGCAAGRVSGRRWRVASGVGMREGTTKLGAASVGSTDSTGRRRDGRRIRGRAERGATVVRSLRRQPAALWERWRHARLGAGGSAPRESSRRWRCSRRG